MKDRFRVRRCIETMTFHLELCSQRFVVVNLTVEDEHYLAITAAHRLVSVRKVDNAKPSHGQSDGRL
jgi:hypothetical protein